MNMEIEDLKSINGVGTGTIDKLTQAGYTINILKEVTVEDLVKLNIEKSIAEKIILFILDLENDDTVIKNDDDSLDYNINKASKSLIKRFKKSEEYQKSKDKETEPVIYDKWRKNLNKQKLMNSP
jgi:hypothetical protein